MCVCVCVFECVCVCSKILHFGKETFMLLFIICVTVTLIYNVGGPDQKPDIKSHCYSHSSKQHLKV